MIVQLVKTLFKIFQFFSYALATFTFVKLCVLPVTGLISSLVRNLFSIRNPQVNWPGRTFENRMTVRLVSPVVHDDSNALELPRYEPRVRVDPTSKVDPPPRYA
jgi:hypothetical protein